NLIRKNDDATRLGIVFVHELYKLRPDMDQTTALKLTDQVVDAWKNNYGPNRGDLRREIVADLDRLGKLVLGISGKKVTPQQAADLLPLTYGAWARQNQQFEHRIAFVHGSAVLKQVPAGWMTQYSVLSRPEAILGALEFADTNRRAADVMSVYLKKVNRVG